MTTRGTDHDPHRAVSRYRTRRPLLDDPAIARRLAGAVGLTDGGDAPDDGASPCTLVCTLDADGHCLGCARTIDEIAAWATLPLAARREILAALPARRVALG